MSSEKKSFVLHVDSLVVLKKMSNEQAGIFIKAVLQYQEEETLPELPFGLDLVFELFVNQFKRDHEKYLNILEKRRLAGAMGGRQKVANASTQNQELAPSTNNDSVSVNVNESVNVTDNVNDIKGTKKFVPPTIDEVSDFFYSKATDKKLGYEYSKEFAEKFIGHYTLTNWKYGKAKVPIKDWKLALANSWNVDQWIQEQEQKKIKLQNNGQQQRTPTVKRFTGGVDPPPPGTPFGQL